MVDQEQDNDNGVEQDNDNGVPVDEMLEVKEDNVVDVSRPIRKEVPAVLDIEGMVESVHGDQVSLDYYHGRPMIYIWEPHDEDVQFAYALPTKSDPEMRPYIINGQRIEETYELLHDTSDAEASTNHTGWPTDRQSELEFWDVMNVSLPDHWPDDVSEDDGPFALRNVNNDVEVGVGYIPEDSNAPVDDDTDKPCWIVRGPNSIHYYEDTLEDAQFELYRYVAGTERPSGMV